MPYDSRAIANPILDLGNELHVSLTHVAVHKRLPLTNELWPLRIVRD